MAMSQSRVRHLQSLLLCLASLLWSAQSSPGLEPRPWSQSGPRLQLSHSELRNGSAVFWEGGVSGGYQALLLDEDQGWLLVGGKDHIYLLKPDSLDQPTRTIYWPAAKEHVEHCRLAGKSLETECANFVRLLQPFNKTHIYACGTGAYHPKCNYLHLGHNSEPLFMLSHSEESGQGKCPFSPKEPFAARLTDGELYSGTSVDFMGANAAIFRTSLVGSSQHYIRTEAYDHNWLNEPEFVDSFSIPDTHSSNDDKVYFFFKERAAEAGQWDKKVYSRVARVCKNDVGGKRSLINRWTTFLKARLVCSIPGPSGVDTQFDELEDIFVLETKDPQNPTIYGVFSTSSSIFRGSAVCVYSMASIRAAFNGPFAHKEGPDYRWVEYKGRIPYPRPGTCPSETYDALYKSTKDLPDEVVSFMRQHQLMWEPVGPLGGRPILTRVNSSNLLKKLVVDRVDAEDGPYDVLHLGTDDGKVVKAVSVIKDNWESEEIFLEELTVFQSPTPILNMELSTKRQQLYVSSERGVVQLALQRCEMYGDDCAECCLARDPYCSWDGQTCSRYFPTSKRRARRQDVKYGDPWSQCPITDDGDSQPMDVCSVHHNDSFLRFSVSLLGYGFYGDVLSYSESKRWLGPARYDLADDGKVVKAVSVIKDNWESEEIFLEELTVFQSPTPILNMELSTKRQQLYVSSERGVVQLALQRCEMYGDDCAECCLARDPYCSWDGQTCSRYFPTSKRRARRQDVKYGDPWSQCPITDDDVHSVEVKQMYAVEGNSSFLECVSRSLHAETKWTFQLTESQPPQAQINSEQSLQMKRGLLLQHVELSSAGVYICTSFDHSYKQVLAKYRLHVIPNHHLRQTPSQAAPPAQGRITAAGVPGFLGQANHRNSWIQPHPPVRNYNHVSVFGTYSLSMEDCEQLWYREKRRQQKLRTLKLKQESRKARIHGFADSYLPSLKKI
uniref:Semaphorin-3D-like n=1 Tax=Knipowitschia caucasica TaxID=637954 RepID=A0AAV2M8C2_KNICA